MIVVCTKITDTVIVIHDFSELLVHLITTTVVTMWILAVHMTVINDVYNFVIYYLCSQNTVIVYSIFHNRNNHVMDNTVFNFRHVFRYHAVLLRARFDQNKNEVDMRVAKKLLLDGERELFLKQHPQPVKCNYHNSLKKRAKCNCNCTLELD